MIRWLVVIDIPDERVRSAFDHMHSWFATESEAIVLLRMVQEHFGTVRDHEGFPRQTDHVAIGPPAICPRCGATSMEEPR